MNPAWRAFDSGALVHVKLSVAELGVWWVPSGGGGVD